jgi:two-component system sensor histidine kinase DegS
MPEQKETNADTRLFARLRRSYLLALSVIGLALLGEHLLVESFLDDQAKDANIINVAGRQRMLSQRIAKLGLLPEADVGEGALRNDLDDWFIGHTWLRTQLSGDPILPQLEALDTLMARIKDSSVGLQNFQARPQDAVKVNRSKEMLNARSDIFLSQMEIIVGEISAAATGRVNNLRRTKTWINLGIGGILLLELLFIFQPISRFVRRQFLVLQAEKTAQAEARLVAEQAVIEKAASLRELHALNRIIDRAALFATLHPDGTIVHLSRKFAELLGISNESVPVGHSLEQYLHQEEGQQSYFAETIAAARTGNWQGEWQIRNHAGTEHWLEVSLLSSSQGAGDQVFLLASDVTGRKKAEHSLQALGEEKISEEVERSKQRSRQIVEAQETERLRVARDLHDGIGQKLTALKFSLESLRPDKPEQTAERINQLKTLSKEIILGVRLATFNLTPPELIDYGLGPALEKMAHELSRLTDERVVFRNDAVNYRLNRPAEINLYRTVQEAVNNAIKYARANYILITLSAGPQLLSITIDDDGEGFDREDLYDKTDGSGLGLHFMEERISNLNGRIFMRSNPDVGTRISVNVPLSECTLKE